MSLRITIKVGYRLLIYILDDILKKNQQFHLPLTEYLDNFWLLSFLQIQIQLLVHVSQTYMKVRNYDNFMLNISVITSDEMSIDIISYWYHMGQTAVAWFEHISMRDVKSVP